MPQPGERDGERPAPQLRRTGAGGVEHAADHPVDGDEVDGGDAGGHLTGGDGAGEQVADDGGHALVGAAHDGGRAVLAPHGTTQGRVGGLELELALEEADDPAPGVLLARGLVGEGADGVDVVAEDGVEQVLPVGEAAVDGPDAHLGLARDRVVGDVQTPCGT